MSNELPNSQKGSLDRAIDIATEAHRDQLNKAGEPYIFHPMRVMKDVATDDEKIVAALHDVVEKNPKWTLERLADEGFSKEIIAGVDALTHRPNESYEDSVRRAAANPIGRTVKLADLRDNFQMAKIAGLETDKYQHAIEMIKRRHQTA